MIRIERYKIFTHRGIACQPSLRGAASFFFRDLEKGRDQLDLPESLDEPELGLGVATLGVALGVAVVPLEEPEDDPFFSYPSEYQPPPFRRNVPPEISLSTLRRQVGQRLSGSSLIGWTRSKEPHFGHSYS